MDNCNNLNTTYETDSRSPLKELYQKNNMPAELCDNQNKNVHLFDMESSFLQNTVMIPSEFDTDHSNEFNVSVNSNQENLQPRYSVLNTFDPIVRKETEELKPSENSTVNFSINSSSEKSVDSSSDSLNGSKTLVNDQSSASNYSGQSDSSVLNTTVILNKSLTVENKVPDQILVDKSLNVSSLKTNHLLPVGKSNDVLTDQNVSVTEQASLSIDDRSPLLSSTFNTEFSYNNLSKELITAVVEQERAIRTADINDSFLNAFSDKLVLEPKTHPSKPVEILNEINKSVDNSVIGIHLDETIKVEDKCEDYLVPNDTNEIPHQISLESLKIAKDLIEEQKEEIFNEQYIEEKLPIEVLPEENLLPEVTLKEKLSTEVLAEEKILPEVTVLAEEKLLPEVTVEEKLSTEEVAEEKLLPEVTIEEKLSTEEKIIPEITVDEKLSTKENILPEITVEDKLFTEITAEIILEEKSSIVEKIPSEVRLEEKLPIEVILKEKSSVPESTDVNETIEIVSNQNEDISFKLTKTDLIVNETIDKTDNILCVENKNVSFEIVSDKPNVTKGLNDLKEEKLIEKPNIEIVLNSTYENKVSDLADKVITSNTVILEETHMSAPEPNSGVIEPSVANRLSLENSATSTNDMGEIINQNEIYEKQSDISNGAIDNKEALEAKARVFNEMAEKCATAEIECEKYKVQVADLKKELKTCRQKTVALEAEVADLKRRENELNVLLEDYKQAAACKSNTKDQDEQIQCLQANEEALKTEVKELKALLKQHETHLKELQRKEVKLADDLSCKTQSEMQISRVMEEYEKSISNLISENEKMKKERDTAQMHLANIEMAFSDVHQKYERCKAIVQGYKDNEESFKQDIAMNRETIVIQEQKYETLKAHAMAQLEKSNQELAAMKKQHETEMARLTAQLKRYEIKNMSLMESLQQKAKECEQLSAVCDEFIGNV